MVLLSKGIHISFELELPSNAHRTLAWWENVKKILNLDGFDGKKDVTFIKWCRENKKMKKIEMTLKCDEAIKTWTSSVVNLKQHIHRKCIQVFCLKSIRKDLENADVLLHVDFSGSYKNANQDEIQSAYFGQSSFSIFTACAYTNWEFAPYQSLSLPNQMITDVSLLYHACIKLLVILRKNWSFYEIVHM